MKKLFTLIGIISLGYTVNAQNATLPAVQSAVAEVKDAHAGHDHAAATSALVSAPVAETIGFKSSEHDFGKIPQGKPVSYVFEFTNTGKTALKLDNVQASCGCTTPEWSKDEIAPGATSKITVGYNAAAEGPFTKAITVSYNSGASKVLNIKGEVWKTPATSAPENSSLNNLKN